MKSAYNVFLIIILSLVLPLILFNGSVDDFAPGHMVNIHEISQNGYISETDENTIPGYYAYGSIITQICNTPSKVLLFLPVQLIPFTLAFFLIIYSFCKNYLFASIITLIELITGITGTPKVFFWPHGIGYILFFLLAYISFKIVENKDLKMPEHSLLFIILGSSLVFISYDLFAMYALFLLSLIFILSFFFFLQRMTNFNSLVRFKDTAKRLTRLALILMIVQLGFSRFVYDTFLKVIINTNYIEISGIDKFILHYFSSGTETLLDTIVLNYPKIISILFAFKYLLLLASISLFIYVLGKKITQQHSINSFDCIILSFVFMALLYSIIRLHIGQVVLIYLYLPGIMSIAWLYQSSLSTKKVAVLFTLLLFLIAPVSYYMLYDNNLINSDDNQYDKIKIPSDWYYNNGNLDVVSDELTRGLFSMFYSENNVNINEKGNSVTDRQKIISAMSFNDVLYILNISQSNPARRVFVINYDLNSINLHNWVTVKTWRDSKNKIESNVNINKVYDMSDLSIYITI